MNYKDLFKTLALAMEEYQRAMTNFTGPPKMPRQPKDYTKIRDFLFKKIM